jgi:hypothetical protein
MVAFRSLEQWATVLGELLDEASADGYAVYAKPEGNEVNLYIGYQMHDFGDKDLFIQELGI